MTNRPHHSTEIQKRHLRPSGCCVVECPTCGAAPGVWCNQDQKAGNGVRMLLHETRVKNSGNYGTIGWHTLRHTYRAWLDETGAPMKVQQEQMRFHPDDDERIRTGNVVIGTGIEWEGGRDGAQAVESERLNSTFCHWEFMGVCQHFQTFVTY